MSNDLTILDKNVLLDINQYLNVHQDVRERLQNLIEQLKDYTYLSSDTMRIPGGCYVRYMKKCYVDNDLKIGGFVKMCNRFFIHLEREGLVWKIRKSDYFIFYTNGMNNNSIPEPPKRGPQFLNDDTKNIVIEKEPPSSFKKESKSNGNFKAFKDTYQHQEDLKCKSKFPEVKKGIYQPIEMYLEKSSSH